MRITKFEVAHCSILEHELIHATCVYLYGPRRTSGNVALAPASLCHGKGCLPILVIKAEKRRVPRPRVRPQKGTVGGARLVGHAAPVGLVVFDEEEGLNRIGQRGIDRLAVDDDFVVARMEFRTAVVDSSVLGVELE